MPRIMLFSQRYIRQIEQELIRVDLTPIVRKKIWSWMHRYDASVRIQPDPNDNYDYTSNILAEVEEELRREHGWDDIIDVLSDHPEGGDAGLSSLVSGGPAHFVLDTIQLTHNWLANTEGDTFQQEINKIFDLHECQWRLFDGEFFKLDGDFIGARLAATAHEALARNHFAGAAEEYAKSQRQLCSGEVKDAILYAGKSFESVLKVITDLENANANNLIEEMLKRGFFDDLPSEVRSGFAQNVMKALPFLRNKLGGHGQGALVVEVPEIYGELAIQLAAALHNFLIAKHIDASTQTDLADTANVSSLDDAALF
ncbi:MAG: hypothetical protein OXI57_00940 [Rhodospirillales bacterium]|nr:hypothetical protein [Rhodospirillales bacterium]